MVLHKLLLSYTLSWLALGSLANCGSGVSSDEKARRAYVGLDAAIDKALTLGFQGFNTASSANIAPQTGTGAAGGTLTVTGQVDQGASSNKGMRLEAAMTDYSDDGMLRYATSPPAPPQLVLSLKMIPTGTLDGALKGTFGMSGELDGTVTLDLTLTGSLQAAAADPQKVERRPGTTRIVGTATSPAGVYKVDVTR